MRNYRDIRIERAALHVVAPKAGNLQQTEAELDLEDDVREFLRTHVEHGLGDAQARAARFIVPGEDRAEGLSDRILATPSDLVSGTSKLAKLLYDASKGDDRVSDATLASLLCTGEERSGDRGGFIALLKLDPSSQYRTSIGRKDGKQLIGLAKSPGILPSANERLQKAAFIRAGGEGVDYRMLLVDRQRKADVVSEFFLSKFLGAQLVHDATTRTKILWREIANARNAIQDDVPREELLAVDRYIQGATSGSSINLDSFGDALPVGDDEVKSRFNQRLSAALPDREFDLDRDLTEKLHRRRTFEGDNGLKISVKAEHFESMVDVRPDPNRQGTKVVTIRTSSWTEQA